MIHLVAGQKGSGKTTYVVRTLLALSNSGRPLITNIDYHDKFAEVWKGPIVDLRASTLDETRRFWRLCPAGSIAAIDECHIVYNSRAWGQLQKDAPDFLTFLYSGS